MKTISKITSKIIMKRTKTMLEHILHGRQEKVIVRREKQEREKKKVLTEEKRSEGRKISQKDK